MKKPTVLVGVSAVLICGLGLVFLTPKPLQEPTSQQIGKAFPSNTREIFDRSEKLFLFSLDPAWDYRGKNEFHGFRILGRTQIMDGRTQENIKRAYYDGIADTDFSAACFNPRHGIRAVKNGKTLDLVVF